MEEAKAKTKSKNRLTELFILFFTLITSGLLVAQIVINTMVLLAD